MKIRNLLLMLSVLFSFEAMAQDGGIKGQVVSREGRKAMGDVKVILEETGTMLTTDADGRFEIDALPAGEYRLKFVSPEYEDLDLTVRVGENIKDLASVVMIPDVQTVIDDSVFAEFDSVEGGADSQALPSSLSASKDVFNNIAGYKFSEVRFNVRGYDSQYSNIYLNGIRMNDALTGYGPWSLWSGLNDATREQENTAGLTSNRFGLGGIGGTTNVNARASQVRKGFRFSVANGNSTYRLRVMATYGSGMLDNGWAYAFSVSTRQGGNDYVDGVFYNAYGYFASVEKRFGTQHDLSLTVLGVPTQRGAQQASTQEAYDLLGNNYYNPNVGYQDGKIRNARVRNYHEPIAMLNYNFDISDKTRLSAAASLRFGRNGYSALTWKDGADPRPDYYRYLPSYYKNKVVEYQTLPDNLNPESSKFNEQDYFAWAMPESIERILNDWRQPNAGMIDWDGMYNANRRGPEDEQYGEGHRANYMVEERHTDQLDFNFAARISHIFDQHHSLTGGLNARINRTEYYDKVGDLLGGDYWVDVDKFSERDFGNNPIAYQNDLDYYLKHGKPRVVKEGDKFSYDYYAQVREASLWAKYGATFGGFTMDIGAEAGYSGLWRHGLWRKGLFLNDSKGDSKKLNYFTYKVKGEFTYRISGAHVLNANVMYSVNPPKFQNAFVSSRTRNDITPGLSTEKIFAFDFTYSLKLPWITARLSAYYTTMKDQSKVISFYDDIQSSFTNFAMSGIDKRYCGAELGLNVPIAWGLAFQGAVSYGDYVYTSNPNFTQTIDNSREVITESTVFYKDMHVESTPQFAANAGLNYRGPHNWFASVDFNFYDNNYISMNPLRRTTEVYQELADLSDGSSKSAMKRWNALKDLERQENFGFAWTMNLSVGKMFYIRGGYTLGVNLEVKNLVNNQNIRTGGYEQMRLSRRTYVNNSGAVNYYAPFDSKYFYMLGTTYYLNVYFRF